MKNNLRILLAKRRLKTSDLAEMTGLSKSSLIAMYYERSNPTIQTLRKISEALGVTITDLIAE